MSDRQFQLEEFEAFLDPYPGGLPEAMQRQLAGRYAGLWGVHDGMSWKNGYPVPGRTNYPLPFDHDRQPKPALRAVLAVPRAQ